MEDLDIQQYIDLVQTGQFRWLGDKPPTREELTKVINGIKKTIEGTNTKFHFVIDETKQKDPEPSTIVEYSLPKRSLTKENEANIALESAMDLLIECLEENNNEVLFDKEELDEEFYSMQSELQSIFEDLPPADVRKL